MEYGKFSSAEELLRGYEELEKSFTRKCQQLADFQKQAEVNSKNDGTSAQTPPSAAEDGNAAAEENIGAVPAEVNAPAADNVSAPQPLPRLINGGGNVSMALPSRPKTIKEASVMAKQLFNE